GGAVAQTPGTAVAFDQRGKRPLPARPEYAREQRLVAVTEVFDVLHVELISSGSEHCSRHSKSARNPNFSGQNARLSDSGLRLGLQNPRAQSLLGRLRRRAHGRPLRVAWRGLLDAVEGQPETPRPRREGWVLAEAA